MISLDERIEQILYTVANDNFFDGIAQGDEEYAGDGYHPDVDEAKKEIRTLISSILDELIPEPPSELVQKINPRVMTGWKVCIKDIQANRKRMGL